LLQLVRNFKSAALALSASVGKVLPFTSGSTPCWSSVTPTYCGALAPCAKKQSGDLAAYWMERAEEAEQAERIVQQQLESTESASKPAATKGLARLRLQPIM